MKGGETVRFDCTECNTEFEIKYEPRATPTTKGISEKKATFCPFCGTENLESDED